MRSLLIAAVAFAALTVSTTASAQSAACSVALEAHTYEADAIDERHAKFDGVTDSAALRVFWARYNRKMASLAEQLFMHDLVIMAEYFVNPTFVGAEEEADLDFRQTMSYAEFGVECPTEFEALMGQSVDDWFGVQTAPSDDDIAA